jgi:uncharacterized protein YjbI with pentapeptide repeats
MKTLVRIFVLMLMGIVFVHGLPALGREQQEKDRNGTKITREDLLKILGDHKRYLKTEGKRGKRADLTGTNLVGVNLRKADLRKAILEKADLTGANLKEADLNGAHKEYLKAEGTGGKKANLTGANLNCAKLVDAILSKAHLQNAILIGADLTDAHLTGAYLTGADLTGANLSKADLSEANLSNAVLEKADLTRANLSATNLSQVVFDVKPGSVPTIHNIAFARNLSELRYKKSPVALVRLRQRFKKDGFRTQEREITYAIRRTERQILWNRGPSIFERLESLFNYMFFELTCQYGMNPGRPLIIAMVLIPLFSFFYIFALRTYRQKTGIWLVFPRDRVLKGKGQKKPRKLSNRLLFKPLPSGKLAKARWVLLRWDRVLRISLYFSLLSAFGIGFREINVRSWITRLQRQEYILRPTGWVRILSGFQSLINVYLVALWVVTYFGHPFEAY